MGKNKFEARQQQKALNRQRDKQECHELQDKIKKAESAGMNEYAWELRRKRNRLKK